MRKYYTRACNFYHGKAARNLIHSKKAFPLNGKKDIAFDKIEIFKGNSASVLYGEGAIGGSINIITNPTLNNKKTNEIMLKNGTFNSKEYIWNNNQKFNKYSFNTF